MNSTEMSPYPDYDVLATRDTLSWNDATRRVIAERLAIARVPRFFTEDEWRVLDALCGRILPQGIDRPQVPIAALLDASLFTDDTQGFRVDPLPYDQEAWRRGLKALDREAQAIYGAPFHALLSPAQDELLKRAQTGELHDAAWHPMTASLFFEKRILVDIPAMYYAHPTSWNEIGFGGPAGPRGYVRMELNRRDPWEAEAVAPGARGKRRVR